MNIKYHQFKSYPILNSVQPTNMIRQHTYAAAALEQTIPAFDQTAFFQQLATPRFMQKLISHISAGLLGPPLIRLSASKVQRRKQHRMQSFANNSVQRFAVITAVGNNHLHFIGIYRRHFVYQLSSNLHFLYICARNYPRPQQSVLVTDSMQGITSKPLTATARPAAIRVAAVWPRIQNSSVHYHFGSRTEPKLPSQSPQYPPQQPSEICGFYPSSERRHRRQLYRPVPVSFQPPADRTACEPFLGYTYRPIHQCSKGPYSHTIVVVVYSWPPCVPFYKRALANSPYLTVQSYPQPAVHNYSPFNILLNRKEYNCSGRLCLLTFNNYEKSSVLCALCG